MAPRKRKRPSQAIVKLLDRLEQHRSNARTVASLLSLCNEGKDSLAISAQLVGAAGEMMERELQQIHRLLEKIGRPAAR